MFQKENLKIIHYCQVSSTMDVASDLIDLWNETPFVVIAEKQTKGRGRGDNSWFSVKGGLYTTYCIPTTIAVDQIFLRFLHYNIANILHSILLTKFNVESQIKWPNDILYENKKLAGILLEWIKKRKMNYLLIGIGINVNNESTNMPIEVQSHSISLKEIIKEKIGLDAILSYITNNWKHFIGNLETDIHQIRNQYNKKLKTNQSTSQLIHGNAFYEIIGINEQGFLEITNGKTTKQLDIDDAFPYT